MLHVNRMVFGRPVPATSVAALPRSCVAVVVVAGALVLLFGLFVPAPCTTLLLRAAAALQG